MEFCLKQNGLSSAQSGLLFPVPGTTVRPSRKCATEQGHITPLFYGSFHLFNAI